MTLDISWGKKSLSPHSVDWEYLRAETFEHEEALYLEIYLQKKEAVQHWEDLFCPHAQWQRERPHADRFDDDGRQSLRWSDRRGNSASWHGGFRSDRPISVVAEGGLVF